MSRPKTPSTLSTGLTSPSLFLPLLLDARQEVLQHDRSKNPTQKGCAAGRVRELASEEAREARGAEIGEGLARREAPAGAGFAFQTLF